MKKVFTFRIGDATIGQFKGMLEESGIACVVRNELLVTAIGEIPVSECYPELWVVNDNDYASAQASIDEWKKMESDAHHSWPCPNYGQHIEKQFTACWKCGTEALRLTPDSDADDLEDRIIEAVRNLPTRLH